MVNPKSTLKKRGEVYYLHYFENGVRKRLSLGTDSLRIAEEKRRRFDSARVCVRTTRCTITTKEEQHGPVNKGGSVFGMDSRLMFHTHFVQEEFNTQCCSCVITPIGRGEG